MSPSGFGVALSRGRNAESRCDTVTPRSTAFRICSTSSRAGSPGRSSSPMTVAKPRMAEKTLRRSWTIDPISIAERRRRRRRRRSARFSFFAPREMPFVKAASPQTDELILQRPRALSISSRASCVRPGDRERAVKRDYLRAVRGLRRPGPSRKTKAAKNTSHEVGVRPPTVQPPAPRLPPAARQRPPAWGGRRCRRSGSSGRSPCRRRGRPRARPARTSRCPG